MTMTIDPKTGNVTYSDPQKGKAFMDKLAQAMVDNLNRKVKEEQDAVDKATKDKTTK